ncbi:alpha/beta fold hydrolase [Streptomyces hesseae]|uniref:Alpha/beta hydrolase n=1 Tax=Streptomyces hesseae TaxID=3075519 RepID=A0ABU2SH05_9ACTN|nr:alpha/beta hydrolase [Streptomyces sp. DSM 40473]MDT0448177.1 alpha/beta hydrolase [Streptomyces sp. DSM 40473]
MTATRHPRLNTARIGPPGRDPVVLVHGIATDNLTSYYFTVAPALAAAGHDVLMYDQRGHGRSERPPTGYRLEDFTGDLAALLDDTRLAGPVHLVGNSFGGTVALDYALRHPDRVAGVLVVESEPPTAAWAAKMSTLLGGSAHRLHDERALPWIERTYGWHAARLVRQARPLLHGTTIAEDIAASRIPPEERWRDLDLPVLAVYGATSDLAAMAPRMESLLPGCRTHQVPGHGHSVLVGAPATIGALILDWVRAGHRHRAEAVRV